MACAASFTDSQLLWPVIQAVQFSARRSSGAVLGGETGFANSACALKQDHSDVIYFRNVPSTHTNGRSRAPATKRGFAIKYC